MSNKSEKNMADFEGEDLFSDDELVQVECMAQQQMKSSCMHQPIPHYFTKNGTVFIKFECKKESV